MGPLFGPLGRKGFLHAAGSPRLVLYPIAVTLDSRIELSFLPTSFPHCIKSSTAIATATCWLHHSSCATPRSQSSHTSAPCTLRRSVTRRSPIVPKLPCSTHRDCIVLQTQYTITDRSYVPTELTKKLFHVGDFDPFRPFLQGLALKSETPQGGCTKTPLPRCRDGHRETPPCASLFPTLSPLSKS